jgi:16S rRNA (uracil1498-N3)-methyltransferase
MITLLIDPDGFDLPDTRVEGEAYQHLFRARRVTVGEEMRVVDGRGRARWGTVERVDRTSATVVLGEPAPDHEPALRLEVIVPTCRPERASWLVEKGTEVGVFAFRFANMARAPRELGAITFDRLRRVAAAAVEQCHRSRLPEITGPHAWSEMVGLAGPEARWFLDTEAADGPSFDVGAALRGRPEEQQGAHIGAPLHALLIGPEGGLDPAERRELLTAGWRPVGLGERTLRLETAAIIGAAFLLLPESGIQNPKSKIEN